MLDAQDAVNGITGTEAQITEALALAFRDALRDHRRAGLPVVVMDDGRIELVPAEQIEQELDATGPDRT